MDRFHILCLLLFLNLAEGHWHKYMHNSRGYNYGNFWNKQKALDPMRNLYPQGRLPYIDDSSEEINSQHHLQYNPMENHEYQKPTVYIPYNQRRKHFNYPKPEQPFSYNQRTNYDYQKLKQNFNHRNYDYQNPGQNYSSYWRRNKYYGDQIPEQNFPYITATNHQTSVFGNQRNKYDFLWLNGYVDQKQNNNNENLEGNFSDKKEINYDNENSDLNALYDQKTSYYYDKPKDNVSDNERKHYDHKKSEENIYDIQNTNPGNNDVENNVNENQSSVHDDERPMNDEPFTTISDYKKSEQNVSNNHTTYDDKEILEQNFSYNQSINYDYETFLENTMALLVNPTHNENPSEKNIVNNHSSNYDYEKFLANIILKNSTEYEMPSEQNILNNQSIIYDYDKFSEIALGSFENSSDFHNALEQSTQDDKLQQIVDAFVEVDKKIKSICSRGHYPSEEYTEEYYKRMFNIEGYISDTATVRIKHTVLYSCLAPVIPNEPCLEDVALLPENLIVEEAVYSIMNEKLTIKIPYKSDSTIKGGDVCGAGGINEKIIIVPKQPAVQQYAHLMDVRNVFYEDTIAQDAIVFRDE